jgi:deazaflavin-dependent oxidoreductase (nitroreductase family)
MTSDALLKFLNAIHRPVFRLSGGRLMGKGYGMPVVALTTTGRTSGQPRTVMLTSPLVEGDRIVLVASKGGDDRDPLWFSNLVANPDVDVEMGGTTRPMRARVAEGEERDELWTRLTAAHDNYAGYQRKTERRIPVVVCEPRPGA